MARDITGTVSLFNSYAVPTNNLLRFRVPTAGTLVKLSVYSATAPSGDDAEFDIKKNGGSVDTLTLPDGDNDAFVVLSEAVVENDLIRVDLTSTPSSIGNDLTVTVVIQETGASATDANLLARANHTGSQAASTISDFSEAVDDRVNALVTAGAAIKKTYDDAGNNYTIDLDITELTEDATPDAAADYLVTYDASASAHKKVKLENLPSSGPATNFTDLDDVPASYTGEGGKLVVVNGTEDGLEFIDAASAGDTAPGDIYVDGVSGDDVTGDGTIGLPYETIAKALSVLPYVLMADHTIHLADATYAEGIDLRKYISLNNSLLKITGNTTTPANVSFTGTKTETTRSSSQTAGIVVSGPVRVEVEGIRVNATADNGLWAHSGAIVIIDRCTFTGTLSIGVLAQNGATLKFSGNITVSGWSSTGIRMLGFCHGYIIGAGTITITGPGSAGRGVHILNNSQFATYSSDPSGCNITITGVQFGFQLAFASSYTLQASSSTITVDNSSTPGSSAGVMCTDHSSWSTNQTVTLDNLSFGYQANSISYIEAVSTRNHTNLGGTSDATQNSVIYLP